jgi:ATP dependent DNA ligase C terminal region
MAWQKLWLNVSQEFVVGGYSPGNPFDALLVGYYDEAGALKFAARVRAGFTPASRRQVFRRLGARVATCPFANLPMGKQGGWNEGVSREEMQTMTWVGPELVARVAFVEWTDYGLLRRSPSVQQWPWFSPSVAVGRCTRCADARDLPDRPGGVEESQCRYRSGRQTALIGQSETTVRTAVSAKKGLRQRRRAQRRSSNIERILRVPGPCPCRLDTRIHSY